MQRWRQKLSERQDVLAGLAIFIILPILTIFLLYPVSLHPYSVVLGRYFDDAFEHIWYLEWYKEALFDLQVSPLFQPDIFYPGGWEMGFAALPPLFPILLVPLTVVIGSVATYNFVLVGSIVFAALGVFMLHRAMGAKFLGGIFAGLVFAFYPNRQTFMHGFMNFLLGSVWMPWMLYIVYFAAKHPQARTLWLAIAGMAYALTISGVWQLT